MDRGVETAWDAEYRSGRYDGEAPVGFVNDILAVAQAEGLIGTPGIYIGCGNGRNYHPLAAGGLDLIGLDLSGIAIRQLGERLPERRHRLVHGDLSALPPGMEYGIVIGIQVFQHGTGTSAHSHIHLAQKRVKSGGLFCIRVNSVGTDIEYEHEILDEHVSGGFTIRYQDGPKSGLPIHFFAREELTSLFGGWEEILGLRIDENWRQPRDRGRWLQWEAIWRKKEPNES